MHARVTRFEGSPADMEKGVKLIKERIIPEAKKMSGFKNGYWLVDRSSGKGYAITLFESESSVRSSEGASEQTRKEAADAGFRIVGVDRCEVIAQA